MIITKCRKSLWTLAAFLFLAISAHAQGLRWDLGAPGSAGAATTSGSGLPFLVAQPGVSLHWCNYPANAVPCTNYATTYTDVTLANACATNAQIVLQGSNSCTGTSDNLGNLGVWTSTNSTCVVTCYSYTLTVNGVSTGPYVWTAGGSGGGGGGGGIGTVLGTTNQIIVTNPTTTPQVAFSTDAILPGNPSSTGNFTAGGNLVAAGGLSAANGVGTNVIFFGKTFTGTLGNSGLFAQVGTVSGTAVSCFDGNGNLTNVGCPALTASAAGSASEVNFRNSVTGLLTADSTFFQNSTTHTTTTQNLTVTGTFSVASNYAQAMSIPISPCTVASFSPPLTLGLSGLCINNDGLVAESVNGAAPIDIPLTAGNSVVLAPLIAQHVVQTQAVAGTNPTLPLDANNFANIRYVTPSWNWLQSPSDNLGTPGANTIHLTPCPLGIDTASAANNYIYRVYLSNGTGAAEAVTVTGGSCTPGLATGTITLTTANVHTGAYTVGSANGGIQEAWNDAWVNDSGAVPIANSQSAPVVKLEADTNYNIYSSIYLRGRGGWLDGMGAYLICATRDRCIYIGTNASLAAVTYHRIYNVNGGSTVVQDGVQVLSVSASAGTYTVTTNSTHTFVPGDVIDCEYYSQKAQQHWVATAIAPTSGTTITAVVTGGLTFTTSTNTFGFCNILNTFIEDNSDHVDIKAVNIFASNSALGAFSYGIVNDNDQQLQIDHLSNRGHGETLKTTANWPISAMYYGRNDQGNAGIGYIHNSEFTNVNCGSAGGNGFVVSDTVCQANQLFGFRYFGSLQPFTATNIYQDVSADNPLYHAQYGQAVPGPMGYLVQGGKQNNVLGAFPPLNQVVQFPCTAGGGAERDYWVIPHSTAGTNPGAGSPLFIGYATACNGGNITVSWPSISLQDHTVASIGTLTWDVLMTTGAAQAPSGTGNYYLTVFNTPVDGLCNTGGICHFVDAQAAPTSGTIPTQVFQPDFWFWPGSYVIQWGTMLHVNSADTSPLAVSSYGTLLPSINADQCVSSGLATRRTPIWVNCAGAGGSAGQQTIAQIFDQVDSSSNGNVNANSKGRLNLGRTFSNVPSDLITLQDSNFLKTLSFAGGRPLNDAADMALGVDQANGFSLRANTSISNYIGIVQDNASYKERLTSALKTFTLPVTITGGSSTLTVAGNTTLNGTANTIAGATTMNGALGINASLTAAGAFNYAAGGGTAQAQTVTLAPAVGSLVIGLDVRWLPSNANSGAAPTLAVNGLTAKPITKNGTQALVANDLTTTAIAEAVYDGTEFQLLDPQTNFTGAITWPLMFTSGGATLGTGTGTEYLGAASTGGTEPNQQWPLSRAGTVTALYCNTGANVAAGTYTMSLRDNAADPGTAVHCAITGSAHSCNDTALGDATIVAAGDLLDLKVVVSGGPATSVVMSCSLLFQ